MAVVDAFRLVGQIGLQGGRQVEDGLNSVNRTAKATGERFKKVGKSMTNFGKTMALSVTTPILGVGTAMIKMASDAEETQGKFNVVFGDFKDEMEDWAETHSDVWGRSRNDLKNYLAETQNTLVGFGMNREVAKDFSKDIVGLGVDLASFNNLAEDDALRNLRSALAGNHGAVESLGAVLNETTLEAEMQRQGLQGQFRDLDETTKMQLRYATIVSQSTDALGDAERTSDSFANQMRRLQGTTKDLMADIGTVMLPIMTKVVEVVNKVAERFGNLTEGQQRTIVIIGAIIAGIAPLLVVLGLLATAIGAIGVPVALTIAGIMTFIGVLASLWTTNEEFRTRVTEIWNGLKIMFQDFWTYLNELWAEHGQTMIDKIVKGWEDVKEGFAEIAEYVMTKLDELAVFWEEHGEQILEAVTNFLELVREIFEFVLPIIKSIIVSTWEDIKGFLDGIFQVIGGIIKVFTGVMTGDFGLAWEGIKDIFFGAIKAVWNFIELWFLKKILGLFRVFGRLAMTPFRAFWRKIGTGFGKIRTKVKEFVDKIKEWFGGLGEKLKIKIPKPRLPKFKLEGSFSLKPPSVPKLKVSWNARGAIFDKPTVLQGLGENGREGIIPLEHKEYMKPFALAIAEHLQGVRTGLTPSVEVPVMLNGREIARAMSGELDNELERNRRMKGRMKGGRQ